MSLFNHSIRVIIFQINIFFSLIGWLIIGIGLYVVFANWGSLDASFFLGTGVSLALIGLMFLGVTCIACMGVRNQEDKFGEFWTGRKFLFIYQSFMILSLISELYLLSLSLVLIRQMNESYTNLSSLSTSSTVSYSDFKLTPVEIFISDKFNQFFFASTNGCSSKYTWFWNIVNAHCPSTISSTNCQRCYDYSITLCYADKSECDLQGGHSGTACPYTICRIGLLYFFKDNISYLGYAFLIFILFQIFMIVFNCLLICYARHDDAHTILFKIGLLSNIDVIHHKKLESIRNQSNLPPKPIQQPKHKPQRNGSPKPILRAIGTTKPVDNNLNLTNAHKYSQVNQNGQH